MPKTDSTENSEIPETDLTDSVLSETEQNERTLAWGKIRMGAVHAVYSACRKCVGYIRFKEGALVCSLPDEEAVSVNCALPTLLEQMTFSQDDNERRRLLPMATPEWIADHQRKPFDAPLAP
jgi:hypothetical protein